MQGKVEICGINTAKLEVLKNDEMTELLRRTKEGDMAAREKLIRGNLRLVLSVLQRFASRGENMDDLFQVGCIGLIKAVDNFDINQPVRFSTYGVPMIVGEIRRYLRDNSAIRVSRSLRDTAYKVLQARERLLRQSQREPTVEQLAQELAIPREEVVLAMDAIVDPVSLYEPIYSEGGDTVCVMDQVSDRRCTDESWIQRIALKDAISRLTPRERSILMMRFNQGKTQMEVSAQIGISQAQVSRLEKGAIRAIRSGDFHAGTGGVNSSSDGDRLRPGNCLGRGKGFCAGAGHDAAAIDRLHASFIPAACRNIGKCCRVVRCTLKSVQLACGKRGNGQGNAQKQRNDHKRCSAHEECLLLSHGPAFCRCFYQMVGISDRIYLYDTPDLVNCKDKEKEETGS